MQLKRFNKAFALIKEIIVEHNPHYFITRGINEDEFDTQIKAITKMIHRINSPYDASLVIQKVFYSSFYQGFDADYEVIGKQVYDVLKKNKLIF